MYVEQMSIPRWDEYAWVSDVDVASLFEAFCITIVTEATVAQVVEALPTPVETTEYSYDEMDERVMDGEGQGAHVGLVQQGAAVILVEVNGYLGQYGPIMEPMSRGREVVSQYRGGHGVSGFRWYVDGVVRTAFEPDQSYSREGADPDATLSMMEAIGGFWLFYGDLESEPDEPDWDTVHSTESTLALSEAITGVRLTKELLLDSRYLLCVLDQESMP